MYHFNVHSLVVLNTFIIFPVIILNYVQVHAWVGACTHEYRNLQRPEVSDALELELQVVVSHPT